MSVRVKMPHLSLVCTKYKPSAGSNDVEYQLDAPSSDGQTRLPSTVGSRPGTIFGRPSGVRPLAHVRVFAYCVPSRNAPSVRSST